MPFGTLIDESSRPISLAVIRSLLAIGLLLPCFLITLAASQSPVERNPLTPQRHKSEVQKDTRTTRGKLITAGRNTTPFGPHGLLTYKLEELELPESANSRTTENKEGRKTALRLTITGTSLMSVNKLWLGEFPFLNVWSQGPSQIGTIIYPSFLRDDAEISIVDDKGEIHSLPEHLRLPESYRVTYKPERIADGNKIVSIRSGLKIAGSVRKRIVTIEMSTARAFPVINSIYQVQIGRRFFELGGWGRLWVLELTEKEFAELKDGARVAIGGLLNGDYLGRLNKSMLDR